jgi:O-antigen ligase
MMPHRTSGPTFRQVDRKTGGARNREAMSSELLLVYVMWVLMLFEPEWWLASFGAGALKYIPTILFPICVCVALAKADRRAYYWPMGLFLLIHVIALPFVTNRGYAMPLFKTVLMHYVVLVISAATIDTIQKVLPIVTMYLMQFAWWGIHGLPRGAVGWHSLLSNEDAFGPMMVIGVAFASFFALGARSKGTRFGAMITAALSGVGIVASIARGAAMAAALVVAVIWLRSPRKLAMFGGALLVVGTMVTASYVFFPGGEFWTEMASIAVDIGDMTGDTDGEECVRAASKRACGSSTDRWDLWHAGWRVFLRAPVLGAGPGNFGAYAAQNFEMGEARGFYQDPAHLYGRNLHNIHVQVLCEQGLAGVLVFLYILVDFVRRNRGLRTKIARERWDEAAPGRTDIQAIALGLEAAMIGFLASGLFYDQLYTSSFYALIALNFLLSSVMRRHVETKEAASPAVDRRSLRG